MNEAIERIRNLMADIYVKEENEKILRMEYDFLEMQKTNPHNLFKGSFREYLNKYYPLELTIYDRAYDMRSKEAMARTVWDRVV